MRLLFEIDKKDYVHNGSVFSRPSARGIIIKAVKIAMVHNKGFTLKFAEPQLAIDTNRMNILDDFNQVMLEREG